MSTPMPIPKNQSSRRETWIAFDGYIADFSEKDALLRSNRRAGGAILVQKGDYRHLGLNEISVRVGAKVSIVEMPQALPNVPLDPDCGNDGSACIGGDKICCADPHTIVGSCDFDWSCP